MRWEPFMFILLLTTVSCLVILIATRNAKQRGLRLLGLAYLFGLSVILFTPLSVDGHSLYVMPAGFGQVNLTRLYFHGVGFLENILLTIPLGWGLKRRFQRRSLISIGMTGLLISAGIESLQYFMSQHWLINRSSDINDVVANTLGILIGAVIAMIVHAVSLRKGRLATNQ